MVCLGAPARRADAGLVACSTTDLVNAVQAAVTAGGAQPIDLTAGCTYTLSAIHTGAGFVNATGLPYIENGTSPVNLMINGHGATIARDAGAPQFRFFLVFAGNRLELANLMLSGGRAPDSTVGQGGVGGAIDNFGTVLLASVTLVGNRAGDGLNPSGAGFDGGYGGAIYNHDTGVLSISNSAISNNTAGNGGNGIGTAIGGGGGQGGAIINFGTAEITSGTLSGNKAGNGGRGGTGASGGVGGDGGGIYNVGTFTMFGSLVANNTAGNGGESGGGTGPPGGSGGGIVNNQATLTITDSTLRDNTAGNGGASASVGGLGGHGGGIYNLGALTATRIAITGNTAGTGGSGQVGGPGGNGGGLMTSFGTATVANSTVSSNVAGSTGSGGASLGGAGGGIHAAAATNLINTTVAFNTAPYLSGGVARQSATVSLRNTIVADNTGGNCSGTITNTGNNLDSGTTCSFGSANGSKSSANANLGALEDGALTRYHPLQVPSDAIDAGDDATCAAAPISGVDQRLTVRPQGAHCDIGAYEAGAVPPTTAASPTPTETTTGAPTETPTQSPTGTPTPVPPSACAGPSNGRVSCWKGDGNPNDSIGSNHGALAGNTTYAAGIEGQGFSFDGSSSVTVPDAPILNFAPTAPITVAMWVYRTGGTGMNIFGKRNLCTNGPHPVNYHIGYSDGSGQFDGFWWGSQNDVALLPANQASVVMPLPLNAWTHVAGTFDGTTYVIYVNGTPVASRTGVLGPTTSDPLRIGSAGTCAGGFVGRQDEIQLYSRALSAAEIGAIYDAVPPCTGAEGTWLVNNHSYRVVCVRGRLTWDAAKAAAEAQGGYLATITSSGENAFVFNLADNPDLWYRNQFGASIGPWLGGAQASGSPEPSGGWGWVTDELFEFTAWSSGEPNNSGGTENRLHYYGSGAASTPNWNDVSDFALTQGYVIEWGAPTSACERGPVNWPDNGHTYQAVCAPDGITWDAAKTAAEAQGGHLVTITSAQENQFVFDLVDAPELWLSAGVGPSSGPWLGGYQPPGSVEPAGGFRWVTDEPFGYTNWAPGEPNDWAAGEDYLIFWSVSGPGRNSLWNDASVFGAGDLRNGYVIEWSNGAPPTPSVTTTALATETETPTASPPSAETPTSTPVSTETPTTTASATPTATGAPTASPTTTVMLTPSATATLPITDTPTSTATVTPTDTASPTVTEPTTPTPTPTVTASPTAGAAPSPTATSSATATGTPSPSPTGTQSHTPTPTPLVSLTPTPTTELAQIKGRVRKPGPRGSGGLVPAAGVTVEVFFCSAQTRRTCLATLGEPAGSAVTGAEGRFEILVPAAVAEGKLLVIVASIEEGDINVRVRSLVPRRREEGTAAHSGRAPAAEESTTDPVSEAAVRLLDEQGLEHYSDDGIEAVLSAVAAANPASSFEEMTMAQAAEFAESTAASDPATQAALAAKIPSCVGDCDGDSEVTVDELIRGVNIALGSVDLEVCPSFDTDSDNEVTIDELIQAVNYALGSCPG
ncbi:MAG: hypothetical protein HY699_05860 [Deltaproteobacteria bacterium]|nr:hypothetical protein [Deltaproteobacteria bacterium]